MCGGGHDSKGLFLFGLLYGPRARIDAWLNGEMPLESELTADIIESVAEIMAGERAGNACCFPHCGG